MRAIMLARRILRLRVISALEGISYVLLLLVAMPLKYLYAMPQAVSVSGMLHGVLFILFAVALLDVLRGRVLSLRETGLVLLWSLLPLGFLVIEKRLRSRQSLFACR